MMLIAAEVFCNAHAVSDRFQVQQVYNEAVDEICVGIRRQLIAEDNSRDKSEPLITYSNGETIRLFGA
jgi:transposase